MLRSSEEESTGGGGEEVALEEDGLRSLRVRGAGGLYRGGLRSGCGEEGDDAMQMRRAFVPTSTCGAAVDAAVAGSSCLGSCGGDGGGGGKGAFTS
jgi:hypothetical protein